MASTRCTLQYSPCGRTTKLANEQNTALRSLLLLYTPTSNALASTNWHLLASHTVVQQVCSTLLLHKGHPLRVLDIHLHTNGTCMQASSKVCCLTHVDDA
eukprot:1143298-Pelagomonas_calceolata.AAC.9